MGEVIMSITSTNFMLFIMVIFSTYFLILPRYQWIVLLLGSVYFYWLSSKEASIYIGVTIITVYLCGLGYSCAGVPLFRRNGYRQSSGRKPLFRNRDTALN